MKVNGYLVEQMVKEGLLMRKEKYTMENGLMIKLKDLVNTFIQMELNMKECGLKIFIPGDALSLKQPVNAWIAGQKRQPRCQRKPLIAQRALPAQAIHA